MGAYNGILNNIKVLFVEDEELAREELALYLRKRVGKLYVSENGKKGLEEFQEKIPDIVITDLKMPEMSGLELIYKIRELGYETPIIVISALSDSETILKAVDIGIVKYIVKPVDTKKLIEAMEKVSLEILKDKFDESMIVNKSLVLDRKEKKEIERKISGQIAYFIKKYTGKGPQSIQVFVKGTEIDIKAKGVLTIFEESLIASKRNHSLVEYNRRLLYMDNKSILEERIGEVLGSKVDLIDVEIDSRSNTDTLVLSY